MCTLYYFQNINLNIKKQIQKTNVEKLDLQTKIINLNTLIHSEKSKVSHLLVI